MSTLPRSSNNVSLIYLEYFLSYLLGPNFVNQLFLVSQYDTTIKKAPLKKFGAKDVVSIRGFSAVQLAVDKCRYTFDQCSKFFNNFDRDLEMTKDFSKAFIHSKLGCYFYLMKQTKV